MTGWVYWRREAGCGWVADDATGTVIGIVRRHTVTPGERAEWGAARPAGGDWVAEVTYTTVGPLTFHRTRNEACRALHDMWKADPDTAAPEVPAP